MPILQGGAQERILRSGKPDGLIGPSHGPEKIEPGG